jgi:hypothetical protein
MFIKDLSVELSAEAQAAVHGGGDVTTTNSNAAAMAGGPMTQLGNAGFSAFSPTNNAALQTNSIDQANSTLVANKDQLAVQVLTLGSLIGQV